MATAVDKLLEFATPALAGTPMGFEMLLPWGENGRELGELLSKRNGFYAFDSALLVRPITGDGPPTSLPAWNEPSQWISEYHQFDLSQTLFFAEDLFGCQFCLRQDAVWLFEPETGDFMPFAVSVEDWAIELLADIPVLTGLPLAREWQAKCGPLLPGMRVIPKRPFVLGGQYKIENMTCLDDLDGMRGRGSIANQLVDVPEGGEVIIRVTRSDQPT